MVLLTSKGNGRNYYGYVDGKESPVEVIRSKGRFYFTEYVLGEGLKAKGEPIKDFILVKG